MQSGACTWCIYLWCELDWGEVVGGIGEVISREPVAGGDVEQGIDGARIVLLTAELRATPKNLFG